MAASSSSQPTLTPDEVISTYDESIPGLFPEQPDELKISDILWMPIAQHKISTATSYVRLNLIF